PPPRRVEPGAGAFGHQFPLHLGQRRHDVEEEPAGGGRGGDAVGEAAGPDIPAPEGRHEVHKPLHATTQAIQLPDHEHVAGTEVGDSIRQLRMEGLRGRYLRLSRNPSYPYTCEKAIPRVVSEKRNVLVWCRWLRHTGVSRNPSFARTPGRP